MPLKMKLPDAIVFTLANYGRGLTTARIAQIINHERLHVRLDGNPVTAVQIYAVIRRHPQIFAIEGGLVRLLM